MQNYKLLQKKILSTTTLLKNIEITNSRNGLNAKLYPDFEELKKLRIINIESELRWYVVEAYNLTAKNEDKIISYEIVSIQYAVKSDGGIDNEIYQKTKTFLADLSAKDVYLHSHLELDLGLDSIDYVELFIFIEESFGVVIDENIFSELMNMKELYEYIKRHEKFIKSSETTLIDILKEPIEKKLIYSPWIMYLYKTLLFPIFKIYFRLEVNGCDNIPKRACIIAPSHQSMLDGFLIEATLPYKILRDSFFLAYKNVFGTKLLKPIADNGQSILIDANENLKQTMQYSALPIREGKNLVIFPEGARSRDRELLEFRPFFAMLSKVYSVPVVPVVIDGSFEALRSGTSLPKPKKIHVTYLEPIYPENLTIEEITQQTKKSIEKEMRENPVLS